MKHSDNQTNVKTCYETHEIHRILLGSPDMNKVVSGFFLTEWEESDTGCKFLLSVISALHSKQR